MFNEETNYRRVVKVRPQHSIKRHKSIESKENNHLCAKNNQERRNSDLERRRESIRRDDSESYDVAAKVNNHQLDFHLST